MRIGMDLGRWYTGPHPPCVPASVRHPSRRPPMDADRFDSLTKAYTHRAARRRLVAGLLSGTLASLLVGLETAGRSRNTRSTHHERDRDREDDHRHPGRRAADRVTDEKRKKKKKKKKKNQKPPSSDAPPAPTGCPPGLTDCPPDGCVDLRRNAVHCGACGEGCVGADAICIAGTCGCPAGLTWCAAEVFVCRDLRSDAEYCGTCDTACKG